MLIALLMVLQSASADCESKVGSAAIEENLTKAEDAYRTLDEVGFRDTVNELAGLQLPCAKEKLEPAVVAHYHRVMAVHLMMMGDMDAAKASMGSAKAIDPEYVFDDGLLPPNHELRAHYDTVEPDTEKKNVPEPKFGSLAFDGQNGRARPKELPTIAQLFDDSGLPKSTTYLGVREPLPSYQAIPRKRNMLLGCTAGALALSGTTYALAWSSRSKLYSNANDPSFDPDSLDAARARTNLLALSSSVFVVGAGGCGAAAGVIGQQ